MDINNIYNGVVNVGADCWDIINEYKLQVERAELYNPVVQQLKGIRRYHQENPHNIWIRIICYQPRNTHFKKILFDYKLCNWCGRNVPLCQESGQIINGQVEHCPTHYCPHNCSHKQNIPIPFI